MKTLRIFRLQSPVSVLGPGQRAVVWVQGCSFACKNCIVPESWDTQGGEQFTVAKIATWILAQKNIEGITFSGGEPMLQANGLAHLVDLVQAKANVGVICYTGYKLEHLQQQGTPEQKALLQRIDLLIDGVYVEQLHGDLLWRGSTNQRLLPLTERYRDIIEAQLMEEETSAGLEFFMEPTGEISFVGVPNQPGFREEFESRMLNRGIILKTQQEANQ